MCVADTACCGTSRCGIVHLDADDKDWRWLAELKLDEIELIVSSKTLTVGDGTSVQTIDAVRAMLDQVASLLSLSFCSALSGADIGRSPARSLSRASGFFAPNARYLASHPLDRNDIRH